MNFREKRIVGVFIGTEKAILLGAQLQSLSELMSRDYSELSSNQCAELIAEKVADFIKIIVADKVARKAMPGLKRSGKLTSSHANNALEASAQEAVTPEGLVVNGPHVLEEMNVLKNTSEKVGSKTKLSPLGLGSTGRSIPANLNEQLALKEIMSNPASGDVMRLSKGMTDLRWPKEHGWVKMFYYNESFNIEIHYVAQWENGILKAVDDFKFKEIFKK